MRMYDTGSTAFMLVCTMLVLLMTPGLAFFYGGLSRRKNVINTMFMSLMVIGIAGLTWVFVGWSLAYGGGGDNPIIGGFDQVGLAGTVERLLAEAQSVSDGTLYPTVLDIVFQMAFALITAGIVTGSVAGRMRFGAIALFIGIWSVVVYAPLAHMVWGGEDSLIGGIIGALDFAGGDVVHISSGLTGLVLCLFLGGRKGFGLKTYRAHNVPFVALGAGLLWFGWFGFNGGSAFAADHIAVIAVLNTVVSSAAGMAHGWSLTAWQRESARSLAHARASSPASWWSRRRQATWSHGLRWSWGLSFRRCASLRSRILRRGLVTTTRSMRLVVTVSAVSWAVF